MLPNRWCCIGLHLMTLAYTVHSIVMLTANSEDVKKIARTLLSESLSEKIAAYISNSSRKTTEKYPETRNDDLNKMQHSKEMSDSVEPNPDAQSDTAVDRGHRNRASLLRRKPVRTTERWGDAREGFPLYKKQFNNSRTEPKITHIEPKIQPIQTRHDRINNKYKKEEEMYRPSKIEDMERDLMEANDQFHELQKLKLMNVHKTKQEPLTDDTEIIEKLASFQKIKHNRLEESKTHPDTSKLMFKTTKEDIRVIAHQVAQSEHHLYNPKRQANRERLIFDNQFSKYKPIESKVKRNQKREFMQLNSPSLPNARQEIKKEYSERPKEQAKRPAQVRKELTEKLYHPEFLYNKDQKPPKKYISNEPEEEIPKKYLKRKPKQIESKNVYPSGKFQQMVRHQMKLKRYPNHNMNNPKKLRDETTMESNDRKPQDTANPNVKSYEKKYYSGFAKPLDIEASIYAYNPDRKEFDKQHQSDNDKSHDTGALDDTDYKPIKKQQHFEHVKPLTTGDKETSSQYPKMHHLQSTPDTNAAYYKGALIRSPKYSKTFETETKDSVTLRAGSEQSENKETIESSSVIAHFLTTSKLDDENISIPKRFEPNRDKQSTESQELDVTTATTKEGVSIATKSKVYHELQKNKEVVTDENEAIREDSRQFKTHTHKPVLGTSGDIKLTSPGKEKENEKLWQEIENNMTPKYLRVF